MKLIEVELLGQPHEKKELLDVFGKHVKIWPNNHLKTFFILKKEDGFFKLVPSKTLFTVSPLEREIGDMLIVKGQEDVYEYRINGKRLRIHIHPCKKGNC